MHDDKSSDGIQCEKKGRLPKPRYLKIKPEVLKRRGVRIAFGIANANQTEILPVKDAIGKLDVEVLYTRTNWKDAEIKKRLLSARKIEILVPDAVPLELITGVV